MFVPALCNHCRDAPCVKACPTGALRQREDGGLDFEEGSTPFGDRAYAGLKNLLP